MTNLFDSQETVACVADVAHACCFISEIPDVFHLTELTSQSGHLEELTLYNAFKLTHFEDDAYSSRRMRGMITQVCLQIVAFSLQTDGSSWPVLAKGKRP